MVAQDMAKAVIVEFEPVHVAHDDGDRSIPSIVQPSELFFEIRPVVESGQGITHAEIYKFFFHLLSFGNIRQ